jgi:hypothetical protein
MKRLIQSTFRLSLAAAILIAVMLPQTAAAIIRYVKPVASGSGDGLSWDNASNNLQDMINKSNPNTDDEVWVFAGTYYPKYTADGWNGSDLVEGEARDRAFVLKAGVKIYGGFTDLAEILSAFGEESRTGTSTLSGDIDNVTGLSDGDAYHVVVIAGTDIDGETVLDGFTISGGNANGGINNPITVNGVGSIYKERGGGIYNQHSSPELTNLIISGNKAGSSQEGLGGGIVIRGVNKDNHSFPVLTNVVISGNTAALGGGIGSQYSSPVLNRVDISENEADMYGGGIYSGDSFLALEEVTISDNTVKGPDGYGGGIYNLGNSAIQRSEIELSNVTITNNKVIDGYGGGIANHKYASSILTDVIISGNYAGVDGGGIYNVDHSFSELENVLISGNSVLRYGGGIYNNESSYSNLTNVTISGNYAEFDGGGISNNDNASPSAVTNTIVWGNGTGDNGNDPNVYNHLASNNSTYDHSLVGGVDLTGGGTGNFDGTTDPQFVSPIAPSPTPTTGGDYHLWTDSPLIGGGDGGVSLGVYEEFTTYYGINLLNPTGSHDFGQEFYNYAGQTPLTVNVKNTGNKPTGSLRVGLSGTNANSFVITANDVAGGISDRGGTKTFNVAPVNGLSVGTYSATVTVTVVGDPSKSQSFNVSFKVDKATPDAPDLNYTLPATVTYNGQPQPLSVTKKTASIGDITVKYDGNSTPVPVNAGEYVITVSIDANANYNAVASLSLGNYTIARAVPTVADLDFSVKSINYDGRPHPVNVAAAKGVNGLGEITVYYNGSTTPPVDRGRYIVTIDIAPGLNYTAVTGLTLGSFSILEAPTPSVLYSVELPSAAGLATSPLAGTYYVYGGEDFTFRLTLAVPSLNGTLPQVQTNRTNVPAGSDLQITPNADGSYTVVILDILQHIKITLSTPMDNASVAAADLEVYAAPGAIAVANSRSDAATLHVYSLAGMLVRQTTVPPGTTRIAVPPGIYIVTDGGAFRRKAAVVR